MHAGWTARAVRFALACVCLGRGLCSTAEVHVSRNNDRWMASGDKNVMRVSVANGCVSCVWMYGSQEWVRFTGQHEAHTSRGSLPRGVLFVPTRDTCALTSRRGLKANHHSHPVSQYQTFSETK